MLAYPVAKLVMGNGTAALFTFVVPFLVSTAGGTLIAALVLMLLRQTGIMGQLRSQIEDN
jgi:predicted membrane protein